MQRNPWYVVVLVGLVVGVTMLLAGCRSEKCARMMACCQQIKEVDGVGNACGSRAYQVEDPKTCQTILETVGHMYEKRGKELPEACKVE